MKKVLITGSETFGSYLTNPSKWLALAVDGKLIAGYEVHSLIFPSIVFPPAGKTTPGEEILQKAQVLQADAIISFGMFSEVKGFRLERSGHNWAYNEKYLSPFENNRPLEPSRPEKERLQTDFSFWDTEKMAALFAQANIPFDPTISDDAGRYSCNSWIYRTLLEMQKKGLNIPYLFVHTACTAQAIELIPDFDRQNKLLIKNENMLQALEIILQCRKQ